MDHDYTHDAFVRQIVLRDDRQARWLRLARPVEVVTTRRLEDVVPCLERVEAAVERRGLFAAGFLAYEAAAAFDPSLPTGPGALDAPLPLLWFALFDQVETCLTPPSQTEVPPLVWQPTMTPDDYRAAVRRIRRYIESGDTYQINFTYRLRAAFGATDRRAMAEPEDWFARLNASQRAPFAALVETDAWAVLSASPELFFRLDGQRLESRPMKGTAPRGLSYNDDLARAAALRDSEKERAENVMIVDMVRNDIGRVARPGTVRVEELLAIEKYPTVWQMTTTVAGETESTLVDIFRALFPAASITGTPKRRAMEIIDELETTPRGVYTGCIGFFAPKRQAQFNVAIRTAVVDRPRSTIEYGIGSGIVWDSQPDAELRECVTKARILSEPPVAFDLFETLLWEAESGYFLLDGHIKRIRQSAKYFSFPFDEAAIREKLKRAADSFIPSRRRVRLLLSAQGEVRIEASDVPERPQTPPRVSLAAEPVDSSNRMLYHKTTSRPLYEAARRGRPDVDDVILWNERGEITEATIANVVVEIDGRRYTPPVSCGLLAGTLREAMLERGEMEEHVITCETLRRAERIWLISSVRQMREVVLIE